MTWPLHQMTWNDMTCHAATNHSSSPHVTSQPTTLLHLTPQATSWHQNRSHYHRGTAESLCTAKQWFGHGAGRSPCAHSIGKFFLCSIVLFSSETSAPGSPGNYLYLFSGCCAPSKKFTQTIWWMNILRCTYSYCMYFCHNESFFGKQMVIVCHISYVVRGWEMYSLWTEMSTIFCPWIDPEFPIAGTHLWLSYIPALGMM